MKISPYSRSQGCRIGKNGEVEQILGILQYSINVSTTRTTTEQKLDLTKHIVIRRENFFFNYFQKNYVDDFDKQIELDQCEDDINLPIIKSKILKSKSKSEGKIK
jgi:hypothetical protein